jgi:glyoxylase-like metal-dependent hydrolase (beta-lactamase superfamily II)
MNTNNCNTYLVDGSTRILIDPGHSDLFGHVEEGLAALDLTSADIDVVLCTHAHPDHLEGAVRFANAEALLAYHEEEYRFIQSLMPHLNAHRSAGLAAYQPDFLLREGELFLRDTLLEILHTPGHAPGAICIHLPSRKALFTGDLVFNRGIGRVDLPGGNAKDLKTSLQRVSELDVDYLLPGHGEPLLGASAVRANFEHLQSVWYSML